MIYFCITFTDNCIPIYVLVSVDDVLDVTAEKKYT